MLSITTFLLMIVATVLSATCIYLLKLCSKKKIFSPEFIFSPLCIATVGTNVLSLAVFLFVLKHELLSVVYALTSMTYIWVAILSKVLLKEHITIRKAIGIGLIVLGIMSIMLL